MKTFLLMLLGLFCGFSANAQNDELNKLTDIVNSLRTGGEKGYKNAIATLAADKMWTPMDELGIDRTVECRASDRVPGFRLNSVLTNAENEERYQTTTGNHLNGADLRYNYSLFEKTLKANKSTSFLLNGRWGEQVLIIMPFNPNARITAKAFCEDKSFEVSPCGGGCLKLTGSVTKGKPLSLTLVNESGENISYVIINYNSRK